MPREWLIQHRAGTLAEWAAAEASGPALLAGERAYITDLKLDVVGDGVTKVASLGAVGSGTYAPIGSVGGGQPSAGFPMRGFGAAAAKIAAGTPTRLKWLMFGDSVAGKKFVQLYPELKRALGGQAGAYGTGPTEGVTINSETGTITASATAWDVWVTGQVEQYATGATRTYGIGGGNAVCDTIRVVYLKGPSAPDAGTFKLRVDGVDAPGFTNVSAANATATLAVATVSVARGPHTVTVTNLTGAHRVIMVGFEDSTVSGICPINVSYGGIGLDQPQAGAWANFTTFLQTVLPNVVSLEMKDSAAGYTAALPSFFSAVAAGAPLADVLGIGSTPQLTNDADGVAQNTLLKAACAANGCVYWDGYTPVKSYATLVALGWQGDGTHVSTACDSYLASRMAHDLGLWAALGLKAPRDISVGTAGITAKLSLGADPTATNADIAPMGGSDLGAFVGRWLRFYSDRAMTTEVARPVSLSGGEPFLQPFVRFGGDAYPGIFGSSDGKLVEFVNNGARSQVAHYAYAKFRGLIALYAKYVGGLAVPGGAVTFDLNNGSMQVIQITADCTSSSITNTYGDNQLITIGFRQDATGGRTYVWPANCRFAGGAAPSDTTANTQTMVTFVWDASATRWHELSRSVAVPVS